MLPTSRLADEKQHKRDIDLRLLPFRADLVDAFRAINQEWIEAMFSMEAEDHALLATPQASIIDTGGHIWFVEHARLGIIGTCALVRRGPKVYEITKMGVMKNARGLNAGQFLLLSVLQEVREMDVDLLFLLTSSPCTAAIYFYRKHGFQDDEQVMATYAKSYKRCNVAMCWVP